MSANKPESDAPRFLPLSVVRRYPPRHSAATRAKQAPERSLVTPPLAYLNVKVDGYESSYFEWLGAGVYSTSWHGATQNGSPQILHELHYGFNERFLYMRVDAFPGSLSQVGEFDFRITLHGCEELRLTVGVADGCFAGCLLDTNGICILGPHPFLHVAFGKILEVGIERRLVRQTEEPCLKLRVELWHAGRALDILPREGPLELKLGTEAFAWPAF